jgi:hypothetical protein
MPGDRAENQGILRLLGRAAITEASAGVDLGDSKSEI